MDSEIRGVSRSAQEVAGVHRPFRNLVKSPMLPIFFSVPRSERAFPPWSLIPAVLKKLRSSSEVLLTIIAPYWPQRPWCPELLELSCSSSAISRPSETAALPSSSSGSFRAVSSCVETIQRFARSQGFSSHVAKQSSLARRSSSCTGYQAKWSIYKQWCRSEGHSISRPSLPKVADFLFWLRPTKKLSVSAVLGYCYMLSAVFRSQLPEISTSPIIQDLLRSFKMEAPCHTVRPPSWDLEMVLDFLRSPVFEPLSSCSLRDLTQKTLFLVSLATAKWVGEIQALSRMVSFFPPLVRGCRMFSNSWLRQRLLCIPFRAHFRFSLCRILRSVFRKSFCCARFALYGSICGGLLSLLIVLVASLCLLVVRLAQCLKMVFLSFCVR